MYVGKSKRLWVLRWFLEEKVRNVLSKGECVDKKKREREKKKKNCFAVWFFFLCGGTVVERVIF